MSLMNEQIIWNYFKKKGLNDYGCAGLLGNLYAESGLMSNNLENTGNKKLNMSDSEYTKVVDNGTYTMEQFVHDGFGYSLAQWTWHERKKNFYEYVKSKNKSIGDIEVAIEFLYKELSESYPVVLKTLKTAKSVLEASNAVLLKFERPADQSVAVQNKRASYGQKYYDKYATSANKGDDDMSYIKGKAVKLSKNFNSTEFDCHGSGCCSATEIDPRLVEYLQAIRDHFGVAVTINSAYRCEKHNAKIGGASKSKHKYGQAADISVKGIAPAEVAKYAESIGILGIGLYEGKDGNFVHVDTRTTKSFWYGHAQAYRSTFGGVTSRNEDTSKAEKPLYKKGKTYSVQVEQLSVRVSAGTNYARKTYTQLSINARKNANKSGYLKKGTRLTCLEVKFVGDDIWIRIPSGWCAAYYDGKCYIK